MKARAFFGLAFDAEATAQLKKISDRLRDQVKNVVFSPPQNFHITLRYMGEIETRIEPLLCDNLQEILADQTPFSFSVDNVSLFPKQSPFIVAAMPTPAQPIAQLMQVVADQMKEFGLEVDPRAIAPHITLARSRTPFKEKFRFNVEIPPLTQQVTEVKLYHTQRRQNQASEYEVVKTLSVGN